MNTGPLGIILLMQMAGENLRGLGKQAKLTRPRGPSLGASDEVAPTSPPTALRQTTIEKPRE